MPYIKIYEIDNTGTQQAYQTAVFVPGTTPITTFKTLDGGDFRLDDSGCYLIVPIEGDDDATVLKKLPQDLENDEYVKTILKSGLCVLYKYYSSIVANDTLDVNFLLDKNEYDVKFLSTGNHLMFQYDAPTHYAEANPQPYDLFTEYTMVEKSYGDISKYFINVGSTTPADWATKPYYKYYEVETGKYGYKLITEASDISSYDGDYYTLTSDYYYFDVIDGVEVLTPATIIAQEESYYSLSKEEVANGRYYLKSLVEIVGGEDYYNYKPFVVSEESQEGILCTVHNLKKEYYTEDAGAYFPVDMNADGINSNDTYYVAVATNYGISTKLAKTLALICYQRGDCCVVGTLDATSTAPTSALKDIKEYLDEAGVDFIYTDTSGTVDLGKYVTAFSAKVTMSDVNTLPDLAYFKAFGAAIKNDNTWEALANKERGAIESFSESAVVSKYDLDNLVMDVGGRSFNGMIKLKPQTTKGAVIWGDRTLLDNGLTPNKYKATSFLSIRNMISDIAKRAYQSAITSTYETNNEVTWTNFKGRIANLLDEMISDYKIANYEIIRKRPSQMAEIACQIHIAPYGPVESFDIGIVLNNTQLSIEE